MNNNYKDIVEFINTEIIPPDELDMRKAYRFFCKCYSKTLLDLYSKFKNTKHTEKLSYILLGANIMNNIFWIILAHTNNLKLTVFLAERSILLFTEFLLLTKNPKIKKKFVFLPNMNDAIEFVFTKTIGNLKMNVSACSSENKCIRWAGIIIKCIKDNYFIDMCNPIHPKIDDACFDFIINHISPLVLTVCMNNPMTNWETLIFHCNNQSSEIFTTDIPIKCKLYLLKNYFDSFIHFQKLHLDVYHIQTIIQNAIQYIQTHKKHTTKRAINHYYKKQLNRMIIFHNE